MIKKKLLSLCALGSVLIALPGSVCAETVGVFYDSSVEQIMFAATDVKTALESKGHRAEMLALSSLNATYTNSKLIIALVTNSAVTSVLTNQGGTIPTGLGQQAYGLQTTASPKKSFWVLGGDVNGAMYGGLQIAENITFDGLSGTYAEQVSPDFAQRGVKLNLPLDKRIPTYSGFTVNTSTRLAIPHVWDMTFWKTWIDQQARNRYNVLSVWVHHPFPALVIVPEYPNASLPNIQRIDGSIISNLSHAERVAFWREVMTYAHDRGFQFYFFCWNVCMEYAEDMYPGVITESETNTVTLDYLSKSMKALLETYPELDGFGISAGDNMSLPKDQRPAWTWKAYGQAAYEYATNNPNRKFTMIHRGLGTSLIDVYDDWGALTNLPNMKFEYSIKYANAHMFSTLTHRWYESDMADANANHQKTWLTLRNDDFLYMDMGDPEFVRGFLNGIPYRQVINSFYIGSDIYHPARTYWCKDAAMNGQLEIKRNWYIQMLWGRIAYNKQISDDVFKREMTKRFPQVSSETLFSAWALASRPLPKVQELTQGSWGLDAHWYGEASLYPNNGNSSFRFLDDFIATKIANTSSSGLCSISNSAAGLCGTSKSTYQLTDEMEADAQSALNLMSGISSQGDPFLEVKINNIKQLAYLSTHFAYKIRSATYKKANQIPNAREAMGKAYCWWIKYVNSMDAMYIGNRFRTVEIQPDWHYADALQLQDYTALGGVGIPTCDLPTFTLTIGATNGVVTPGSGSYASNSIVQLTATGNLGYAFSSWSGAISGSLNPTNLTMNTNKSVTANFVPVATYTLTTSATNGSITLNPTGGVYNAGTVVTVTAIPNGGYGFSNWSGNLTGSVNPTTLTMNGNRSVTANFSVLPPGSMNVLFVVGDAASLVAADTAISNRLRIAGYTVQVMSDEVATAGSATGKALVLTSSTVGAGTLGAKFRDVAVPVINWETGVQDDKGFTTTNNQGNASAQTNLNIINVGHPLAAGLAAGIRPVATVAGDFSWGEPGGSPIIIARLNDGSHPCLYAYEAGAAMTTGLAPARRVHLFLQNNTFASANADGLKLFDAAVSWAIGQAAVPPSWVQPPVLQGAQLRLEWLGGTLQTTTNVAGPWSDVSGAVSPHLQPTTNPAQFFRVRQ